MVIASIDQGQSGQIFVSGIIVDNEDGTFGPDIVIVFRDIILGIGNVDVDLDRGGGMMSVYLVVIDDDLAALLGIAGDVGDSDRPPARRGNNEPTPRRAAQFSSEVPPMWLRPNYSRRFFVFYLDFEGCGGPRFWHRCLLAALDRPWSWSRQQRRPV